LKKSFKSFWFAGPDTDSGRYGRAGRAAVALATAAGSGGRDQPEESTEGERNERTSGGTAVVGPGNVDGAGSSERALAPIRKRLSPKRLRTRISDRLFAIG